MLNNKPRKVVAFKINRRSIFIKCPQPRICGMKYHTHGADGDLNNRVEHRGTHCLETKANQATFNKNVEIVINDDTKRS